MKDENQNSRIERNSASDEPKRPKTNAELLEEKIPIPITGTSTVSGKVKKHNPGTPVNPLKHDPTV